MMKLFLIVLALLLVVYNEAHKFDHVRKYLAEHGKSIKPVSKRSTESWLKNSNTIGLGYNPLRGSPVCYTGVCQGDEFQHAVIKLDYSQPAVGSCTTDLLPNFVELQCIPSADLQTSTEMIATSEHLSESTLRRVDFGEAVRYRRFAASYYYSKETRSMLDTMMKQDTTAMYTRGEVTFGKLSMFEPFMELADTFHYVIEQMPCCSEYTTEIDDYVREFLIDYFGLTYITELILGGVAQETMFVSNKEVEELRMSGEEITQAASVGFYLNFDIKPTPPYNNIQQSQFLQTVQSRRSTKLGGDPAAQTMDDWIKSVPTNPVIMNYVVKDLTTLLTSKHFPNDTDIQSKARLVETAIQRYLDRHQPFCLNNCTDLYHGECDLTNNPPFLLGTCKCRPGWVGYDCSIKEEITTTTTTVGPYVPNWEVQLQSAIGENTRLSIISMIKAAIDTYGKTKKTEIALDIKKQLDSTYTGMTWAVIIGDIGTFGSAISYIDSVCLVLHETTWGWRFVIARTS